jgi:hypothetical protein
MRVVTLFMQNRKITNPHIPVVAWSWEVELEVQFPPTPSMKDSIQREQGQKTFNNMIAWSTMVPIKLLKKMVDDSKHGVLVILEIYKILQMHCNCTMYCGWL